MRKEEKEKWAIRLSKYLVVSEKHEMHFDDISDYLTGIAERLFNRQFSHNLRNWDVAYIIKKAGGSVKRVTSEQRKWNISFVCDLWPTVLFPAKPTVSDLKQAYLKRKRYPEVDKQAQEFFDLLTKKDKEL